MTWQARALARFYDRGSGWVDGTTEFHSECSKAIAAHSRILEIGAGPSNPSSYFFATLGVLTGLDIDHAVLDNRALAQAEVFDGGRFPFGDCSFDACVSNYVLEHVSDPTAHLSEVRRILVPGGTYVFRTPNRYHYVAFVSWLTPHWIHENLANRCRGLQTESHDPYPTVYAINSRGAIRRHANAAGLSVEQLLMREKEPSYGMSSRFLFYPFLAYERFVNSSDLFGWMRANIFAVLRKPRG